MDRIVASWFPAAERGTASAIFNSSQYFALVLFAPILGWIAHISGWKQCFWFLGLLGFGLAFVWSRVIHGVKSHPRINQQEIDYIEQGGGLTNIDPSEGSAQRSRQTSSPGAAIKNAAEQSHAGRHLYRSILHHHAHLVLHHLVPGLSSQARHMSI